jgi:23S rRNA pseudouridine2457 synthase
LVLLTDDGGLQHEISHPRKKQAKHYWAQVEGEVDEAALSQLRAGPTLKDGKCLPAEAAKISPPQLWPRDPPIRERKNIPTSWIALSIVEGRNRQVRRMTAAVGFPTLRLIRHSVAGWSLLDALGAVSIALGEYRCIEVPVSPRAKSGQEKKRRAGAKPRSRHVRTVKK